MLGGSQSLGESVEWLRGKLDDCENRRCKDTVGADRGGRECKVAKGGGARPAGRKRLSITNNSQGQLGQYLTVTPTGHPAEGSKGAIPLFSGVFGHTRCRLLKCLVIDSRLRPAGRAPPPFATLHSRPPRSAPTVSLQRSDAVIGSRSRSFDTVFQRYSKISTSFFSSPSARITVF